jgi:hypothetical protein
MQKRTGTTNWSGNKFEFNAQNKAQWRVLINTIMRDRLSLTEENYVDVSDCQLLNKDSNCCMLLAGWFLGFLLDSEGADEILVEYRSLHSRRWYFSCAALCGSLWILIVSLVCNIGLKGRDIHQPMRCKIPKILPTFILGWTQTYIVT